MVNGSACWCPPLWCDFCVIILSGIPQHNNTACFQHRLGGQFPDTILQKYWTRSQAANKKQSFSIGNEHRTNLLLHITQYSVLKFHCLCIIPQNRNYYYIYLYALFSSIIFHVFHFHFSHIPSSLIFSLLSK